MAKMFYSIEEAAEKLGRSESEVQDMVASGQLSEFRDRDRLMFKREQVDLLAGGQDDDDEIGLGESHIPIADESAELEPISLTSSGSGSALNLDNPKDQTGISIFEADELEEADPAAQTQITDAGFSPDPDFASGDAAASGSGLLDLTREADDTSLGADLLEDVYSSDTMEAGDSAIGDTEDEALFEPTGAESDVSTAAAAPAPAMMVVAEDVDSTWSGIAGGLALGSILALVFAMAIVVFAETGLMGKGGVFDMLGDKFMILAGGMFGLVIVCGVIGMVLGKRG